MTSQETNTCQAGVDHELLARDEVLHVGGEEALLAALLREARHLGRVRQLVVVGNYLGEVTND